MGSDVACKLIDATSNAACEIVQKVIDGVLYSCVSNCSSHCWLLQYLCFNEFSVRLTQTSSEIIIISIAHAQNTFIYWIIAARM